VASLTEVKDNNHQTTRYAKLYCRWVVGRPGDGATWK